MAIQVLLCYHGTPLFFISIRSCFYTIRLSYRKGWKKTHIHECYELVYYYASGKTKINSTDYTFSKDTFALISPNVEHDELHLTDANVLFIGFHCDYTGIANLNGIFEDDKDRTIKHIVHRMKDEFMQRQDGFSEMLNLLVGELAIHLQRLIGTKNQKQAEDRMQYVRNYMDEYFHQKLSIALLADIADTAMTVSAISSRKSMVSLLCNIFHEPIRLC